MSVNITIKDYNRYREYCVFLNNNFTSNLVLSLFFDSILQNQERIIYVYENVAFKRHISLQ